MGEGEGEYKGEEEYNEILTIDENNTNITKNEIVPLNKQKDSCIYGKGKNGDNPKA